VVVPNYHQRVFQLPPEASLNHTMFVHDYFKTFSTVLLYGNEASAAGAWRYPTCLHSASSLHQCVLSSAMSAQPLQGSSPAIHSRCSAFICQRHLGTCS
jgi:hypothetical protein